MMIKAFKPSRSGARGFTLTELMVVLFLAAVGIVLATLFYSGNVDRYRFEAFSRNVMSAVKTARAQAIALQKPVVLRFERSSGIKDFNIEPRKKTGCTGNTAEGWFTAGADNKFGTADDLCVAAGTANSRFELVFQYPEKKNSAGKYFYVICADSACQSTTQSPAISFDGRGFCINLTVESTGTDPLNKTASVIEVQSEWQIGLNAAAVWNDINNNEITININTLGTLAFK
jgi:prepilin-type N-terminal cleavage/methylation domain-containing protein